MLRSFILTCAKPSKKIKKEKVEVGVGRREGREELPVPKLLRSIITGITESLNSGLYGT